MDTPVLAAMITAAGVVIAAMIALVPRILEWKDKRPKHQGLQTSVPSAPISKSQPTALPPKVDLSPIVSENPAGTSIRVFGTSTGKLRLPREMDLRVEGTEIWIDIHNPNTSQWIFWVKLNELESKLIGWNWNRVGEIALVARKASGAQLDVVLKLYEDSDTEIEVQAGKWWIWVRSEDLANALSKLGIRNATSALRRASGANS